MPIIVDANCCAKTFCNPRCPEFDPIIKAVTSRKARLVCGGRLQREYLKVNGATRVLRVFEQAGLLIILNPNDVDQLESKLIAENKCISDDQHVIAIAQLSNARLLCSHDQALHKDFQNKALIDKPRGGIYQNATHAHLIASLGC